MVENLQPPDRIQRIEYLKEIKKRFRLQFRSLSNPANLGIGGGFYGEKEEVYLRVYLERTPENGEELNELINSMRQLPEDVPTSIGILPNPSV